MSELTLDIVARYPPPGTAIPGAFAFSPDGGTLTYLWSEEGSLRRVLWALDVATGERRVLFAPGKGVTDENVSRAEALRRERQRLLHTGVTHYHWAEHGERILAPVLGDLWLIEGGEARSIGGAGALDARLSPDGKRAAFVRDGELHVLGVDAGGERRLTHDATEGVTNGLAEYVAQEELGRSSGFWWSPDGARIAYQQTDERHMPLLRIVHWGEDPHDVEEHRYPFAGRENARVRLGIVAAEGGETRWLALPGDTEYLARVNWHPDGRLFVQTLNRAQTRLELRAYDPATGDGTTLLVEEREPWVNLHASLRFLRSTDEFVWASERDGAWNLYLYAANGTLVRALTEGADPVDGILGVDEEGRRVAYARAVTPLESHVFVASLDGGPAERLSEAPGMHGAVFSRDLSAWVDVHHSRDVPPSATLRTAGRATVLHAPAGIDVPLVTPEPFAFENRDGVTIHGIFYRPARVPAPLVVAVYGGPHAQMAPNSWGTTVAMQAQYLAAQGFGVLVVDGRGSSRRGLAFEGAIAKRMGSVEVDDQVDGVRYAQAQGWVDGDRVGITGWSYGGYMTIMCMLKAPEVFKAGVAGAPVTEWEGYDTGYTERYMRTPQENPEGYRDGSALTHAAKLEGKLLIVHGMIDENVHFRHTARFLDALAKTDRVCDLMIYPGERHSPRSEADRRNMHGRIASYFLENL